MGSPLLSRPPAPAGGPTGPPSIDQAAAPGTPLPPGALSQGTQSDPAQSMARGIVTMSGEIDRILLMLAEAMPGSASELNQARRLLEQAVAKHIAASLPEAPATSPTATGEQFPGGGFTGGGGY